MVFTLNRPDQCFEYPAFLTLQQKSLLIVCLLENLPKKIPLFIQIQSWTIPSSIYNLWKS